MGGPLVAGVPPEDTSVPLPTPGNNGIGFLLTKPINTDRWSDCVKGKHFWVCTCVVNCEVIDHADANCRSNTQAGPGNMDILNEKVHAILANDAGKTCDLYKCLAYCL